MPKLCESCPYCSANDAETMCPACGVPLRSSAPPPAPGWSGSGLGSKLFGSPLGLVGVFVVILAVAWAVGDWVTTASGSGKASDTAGRIRAGMHISEVGQILDNGPPPSPSYPRLRDSFPADEFGDGTIDYEADGVVL